MKTLATNRKAKLDYNLSEFLEAGVVLTGAEVKSAKLGQMSLKGSFARIKDGEAWLHNARISPYKPARQPDYDPTHERKLLLNKKEITRISGDGQSLIPTKVYVKKGRVKVELGIGTPRKKIDKREYIKKRDTDKRLRKMKNR